MTKKQKIKKREILWKSKKEIKKHPRTWAGTRVVWLEVVQWLAELHHFLT